METKLCRICGKLGENYVHIFKTEGLKNKIETCLPIIVSQHCLLPDTICSECLENVENFYSFIKNCLQNIIVLEAQYDIIESCLKTKRKHEKSSLADLTITKHDKNIQTDDDNETIITNTVANLDLVVLEKLDKALSNAESILKGKDALHAKGPPQNSNVKPKVRLVSYDNETDSNSEDEVDSGRVPPTRITETLPTMQSINVTSSASCLSAFQSNLNVLKNYFDDAENNLINEIAQRKKRKAEEIMSNRTKIFRMDGISKRKSRYPKKVQHTDLLDNNFENEKQNFENLILEQLEQKCTTEEDNHMNMNVFAEQMETEDFGKTEKDILSSIPQVCLLCDIQFPGPTALATHVYETHGIDMAKILSSYPIMEEKKKKLPNLLKITDLKSKNEQDTFKQPLDQPSISNEDPPQLQPSFVCSLCPAMLTSRLELFSHLRIKHSKQTALMCSLCFHIASSYSKLSSHVELCRQQHSVSSKYICKICCYHDDNCKVVENHVPVHDFVISHCKKQSKIFDPSDYVETNVLSEGSSKAFTCSECNEGGFASFKEFSTHRRNRHQIFHCDLCNKFYGRNSHLWKHVNRLHKGHPSITCQLCYKTSASKYHLAQHFNKIHSAKPYRSKNMDDGDEDDLESFMNKKFDGFDFQSVKQSFLRQELLEQDRKRQSSENEINSDSNDNNEEEGEEEQVKPKTDDRKIAIPPKEIDSSSDLYTNIITNYTPPRNEGEYKCPKCFRGFHKKPLLKKHKKNCRPRLQKDLLTRCKTCSRIFKDRQSLTKHLINYHSEYVCEICEQKVQSKCEIVSHIRFSHPNCHLFCHCGNILRSKVDLIEHKKDHRNSFVCQFCGDMLPTKIKLKMHILSLHRKILSLSCGICLKLFETQHILRDHVQLVHRDVLSPLTSCTVCGKNYGSKWKTYDHLNKSHGRIFKACKMCLEVFDSEEDLRTHYDLTHSSFGGSANSKTVSSSGIQAAEGSSRKTGLNSDIEPNNDEQEMKNSSSDISNDADAFSHFPQKSRHSDYEDLPISHNSGSAMAVSDLANQEGKISLLEKRLLGNNEQELDVTITGKGKTKGFFNRNNILPPKNEIKLEAKFVSYESVSSNNTKQQDEAVDSNNMNNLTPFLNSSKRTVYVNSNDPSLCEICLKTWPAKKHLWQHYIRCHKTVAATVCGICLKTNDSYEQLQAHLIQNHPTLLHGQGFGSNFICRICGRYHNASSKLKLHMAIHENFDWSLLENLPPKVQNKSRNQTTGEDSQRTIINNGYGDGGLAFVKEEEGDAEGEGVCSDSENINYESLIEQVEVDASSESDNDSDVENKDFDQNNEDSNTSDESDNESALSDENSLENQMLQNMIQEKQNLQLLNEMEDDEDEDEEQEQKFLAGPFENLQKFYAESTKKQKLYSIEVKQEYSSSDSEETSDSVQSISDSEVMKNDNDSSDDANSQCSRSSSVMEIKKEDFEGESNEKEIKREEFISSNGAERHNAFYHKADELDSAIRSISYEQVNSVDEQLDDDICDIQTQTLNQHEIQSAVDSIL